MSNVKISVLMPVYNAEKYLETAIESMLNQTFTNFEFIILDDASTDSSWDIIKKFADKDKRIVAHRNPENLRTTKTLNRGVKIAKGKYIARMDADDWSYPYRLEKQLNFMEEHPEIGVSGGAIEICNKKLETINIRKYPQTDSEARKIIFRYSPFAHPATIWRTNCVKEVGGYNENIPLSQDLDLYFRIGKISKFGNLDSILLKLRTHNDSSSIVRGRYQEQFAVYTRIKAFLELGYSMTFADKLYTFLQMVSMVLIPPKLKFWMFNWFRRIV